MSTTTTTAKTMMMTSKTYNGYHNRFALEYAYTAIGNFAELGIQFVYIRRLLLSQYIEISIANILLLHLDLIWFYFEKRLIENPTKKKKIVECEVHENDRYVLCLNLMMQTVYVLFDRPINSFERFCFFLLLQYSKIITKIDLNNFR